MLNPEMHFGGGCLENERLSLECVAHNLVADDAFASCTMAVH